VGIPTQSCQSLLFVIGKGAASGIIESAPCPRLDLGEHRLGQRHEQWAGANETKLRKSSNGLCRILLIPLQRCRHPRKSNFRHPQPPLVSSKVAWKGACRHGPLSGIVFWRPEHRPRGFQSSLLRSPASSDFMAATIERDLWCSEQIFIR
jgi:hypothetical protein